MSRMDLEIVSERTKVRKKRPTIRSLFRIQEYCNRNGNQLDDDRVIKIYKDSEFYLAAKTGNFNGIDLFLDLSTASGCESFDIDDVLCRLSPAGNTYLHVAAKHGNVDLVNFVAAKKPSLVLSKNCNGDTALHLAAKAGHVSTITALVRIHQDLLPENERDEKNLLRAKNERENTALHEALSNGHDSVAQYLIKEDPELSYYQNKDGEFALHLAAKTGLADCVSLILELSMDEECLNEQFKKKSPIQAAIQGKHKGALEAIFNKNPRLIQLTDDKGKNPLHYAASLGYLEEVRYLLDQYADNVTKRDNSGLFPIHEASIEGHADVVRLLIQGCPYPGELLDRDGCNILHLAAKHGRYSLVSFVLNNPELEDLINMKDKHGNAPLHLATMHWHPKIVSDLTWDKRVDIKLVNDKGMSALDVAEYYACDNPPYKQRLTWVALRAAGTPGFLSGETLVRKKSSVAENYKDRVNTLLLVSTLVATVTFAAGFAVPGGYNSSESSKNLGMATMLRHTGFHMFVFCDAIAVYSSIIVVVALIWAQLGDLHLMLNALTLVMPLLGVALLMMSMAFTAGILLVVSKLRWLGTAFLVMGITFIVILLVLLLPLSASFTSRNRVLSYLFRLMIQATSSS